MKYLFKVIALACLSGCSKQNSDRHFDRYVLALTYQNNSSDKLDSAELTHTICHQLVYLTKQGYCEMLYQNRTAGHFYKGRISEIYADSLIGIMEQLNKKFPNENSYHGTCAEDINLVLENNTQSIYNIISVADERIYSLLKDIPSKCALPEVDTLENVLKYKYYITNKVSYFIKSHDSLPPVNNRYLNTSIVVQQ